MEKVAKDWKNCYRGQHVPWVCVGVAARLELRAGVRESLVWAYANTCVYVKRIAATAK